MLQQIKYFQAVVQNNSFSEAAEECHISQSAISQQIKALEQALGFPLLERKNRRFSLTPAGEYFYRKSLILVADYEQLCREAAGIARGGQPVIRIGHLCSCDNREACLALEAFAARYPRVSIQITYGNHEELFEALRGGQIDLALNDQRRAFSDEYVNLVLAVRPMSVEVASRSPLAAAASLTVEELKNIPCILVASQSQQEQERDYYQTVIGVQSSFLYANTLEEARLLVVGVAGSLYVNAEHTAQVMDGPDFPDVFKPLASNMGKALSELRQRKDVRWTYISPAGDFQAEGERTGSYLLGGEELTLNSRGERTISYADYAIAMVDEAVKGHHDQQRISVVRA